MIRKPFILVCDHMGLLPVKIKTLDRDQIDNKAQVPALATLGEAPLGEAMHGINKPSHASMRC